MKYNTTTNLAAMFHSELAKEDSLRDSLNSTATLSHLGSSIGLYRVRLRTELSPFRSHLRKKCRTKCPGGFVSTAFPHYYSPFITTYDVSYYIYLAFSGIGWRFDSTWQRN